MCPECIKVIIKTLVISSAVISSGKLKLTSKSGAGGVPS